MGPRIKPESSPLLCASFIFSSCVYSFASLGGSVESLETLFPHFKVKVIPIPKRSDTDTSADPEKAAKDKATEDDPEKAAKDKATEDDPKKAAKDKATEDDPEKAAKDKATKDTDPENGVDEALEVLEDADDAKSLDAGLSASWVESFVSRTDFMESLLKLNVKAVEDPTYLLSLVFLSVL